MDIEEHRKKQADSTTGVVPWNKAELMEVVEWYATLHQTPKDDWDLRRVGFNLIDEEKGTEQQYGFRMTEPMNQLGFYMKEKYKGNNRLFMCHMFRFMKILDFIRDNQPELVKLDILRIEEPPSKFMEIDDCLYGALAVLPYSDKQGEMDYDYNFAEVIAKVFELRKEEN